MTFSGISDKISLNRHRFFKIALFTGLIQVFIISGLPWGAVSGTRAETKSLSQAIEEFAKGRKRIRLAIFDFTNTTGEKTRFDEFIADSMVTELSKYPLTLLERKRLKLLLGEHSLSLSGAVDSEKAMKMGMLLPVDMIVSGSYTELGQKIIIHGRIIHVGSGEIVHAFSCSMSMSGDRPKDEKTDCQAIQDPVLEALGSLRNKKEISRAVKQAVQIPFEHQCGEVHYKIISLFKKHGIHPPKYKDFLIQALGKIDDPSVDSKAGTIMGYFASDKHVDSAEWKACVQVLKKSPKYGLHNYIRYMLNNRHEKNTLVRKRVDELIRLGKKKEIGRPVAVPIEDLFFSVLSGLGVQYRKNMDNPVYLFEKHGGIIPDSEKYNKKAISSLRSIYLVDVNRKIQVKALNNLISFIRSRETSDLSAEMTADLIRSMDSKLEKLKEKDPIKFKYLKKDLARVNKDLRKQICYSVAVAEKKGYRYIVEDRTEYVLKNRLKCEHTPTISDLEARMRSDNWDQKLSAIELLSKIGTAASKAEPTVIKYLGLKGYGRNGGRLRRFCAMTLGNIKSRNPEAIKRLIESFPDYDHGVSSESKEAVRKIGVAALPFLIQGLSHEHHAVRYGSAEALGRLGEQAKKAVPRLKEIQKTDKDPYVRKQAAGAVQMIEHDF